MTIKEFNQLGTEEAKSEIFKCCGCTNWSIKLVENRPFASKEDLKVTSDTIWNAGSESDWKEAFTHHPKIGDVSSLQKKFATKEWASKEQSGVGVASPEVLNELATGNSEYEKKFGYIFIVCATGKSADEMLQLLKKRLPNSPDTELKIAAGEQNKITHLRIDKLFS
jgi:2-oxo-4-hydroxy-4-carboxy-5-ureidoimidazoline decarboxylase